MDNEEPEVEASERTAAKKRASKARQAELLEFRELMEHDWGRNIVRRLLLVAGTRQQCYNGKSEDTIFNDGKRKVGLWLESEVMQAAPGSYVTMIEEALYGR